MATIGIDLGTYNSEAAYVHSDGKVILLRAYHGETWQGHTIPSFIKFFPNGEFEKYGEPAREDLEIAPDRVVWGLKRLLGLSHQGAEEKKELHRFKYRVEKAADGSILILIGNKKYTPVEITTIFLKALKKDCESDINPINERITKAIVTYPAYFGDRVGALEDAVKAAGFDNYDLLREPEAAAIAYKDFIDFSSKQHAMVIDWGAGTLDIIVTRFSLDSKGIPRIESMCPPYGDNHLGGIDMDDALFDEAKRLYGLDALSLAEFGKIRSEIEKGKISLSTSPWVFQGASYKGKPIRLKMARSEEDIPSANDKDKWIVLDKVLKRKWGRFENGGILGEFQKQVLFALESEGLSSNDINQLILVGGPMFMPCVRKAIAEVFQGNKNNIQPPLKEIEKDDFRFDVNPLEAVVRGVAIYGAQKYEKIKENEKISVGPMLTAYGYGYVFDAGAERETGNILIDREMTVPDEGYEKREEGSLSKPMAPGEAISISLLKKVKTTEGVKYYKIGDYKYNPYVGPEGPAFIPIVELDKHHNPTLKMEDQISKETFSLKLSNHGEVEIPEPIPPIPLDDVMKSLFKTSANQAAGQEISISRVKVLRQEGENYVRFIDANKNKNFSQETLSIYHKLQQDLKELPLRTLRSTEQNLYNNVSNDCTKLKNCLIAKDGYSEKDIKMLS